MKIKSKRYFEVNYSFMDLLFQNFEVLTQRGDVINPKLARKRVQTRISCTNDVRKMKIKSKRNFEVQYSLMKLFSRNLEILVPCRDGIISRLGQKDSNCISCWYKFRSFLTQFYVNDVITRDKVLKILKLAS